MESAAVMVVWGVMGVSLVAGIGIHEWRARKALQRAAEDPSEPERVDEQNLRYGLPPDLLERPIGATERMRP